MMISSLLLLAVLGAAQQQNSQQCYSCASSLLKSRWDLTGLPRPNSDSNYFTTDCTDPQQNGAVLSEPCGGACFVIMFTDPDNTDQKDPTPFVVRGCHSTMMRVTADRSANSGGGFFCEFDSDFPMTSSKGTAVHVNMLFELCSSVNQCNKRSGTASTYKDQCTGQTQNLLNNQPINCYECTPQQGKNCKENTCAIGKKYCMKRTVKLGDAYQTTKSCSNVNIYGQDNVCVSNDIVTNPGGVGLKNQLRQCFCKNKQYCNGTTNPINILSIVISSILAFAVLKAA